MATKSSVACDRSQHLVANGDRNQQISRAAQLISGDEVVRFSNRVKDRKPATAAFDAEVCIWIDIADRTHFKYFTNCNFTLISK